MVSWLQWLCSVVPSIWSCYPLTNVGEPLPTLQAPRPLLRKTCRAPRPEAGGVGPQRPESRGGHSLPPPLRRRPSERTQGGAGTRTPGEAAAQRGWAWGHAAPTGAGGLLASSMGSGARDARPQGVRESQQSSPPPETLRTAPSPRQALPTAPLSGLRLPPVGRSHAQRQRKFHPVCRPRQRGEAAPRPYPGS